jgi:GMP synthase PP-ATPase subunit
MLRLTPWSNLRGNGMVTNREVVMVLKHNLSRRIQVRLPSKRCEREVRSVLGYTRFRFDSFGPNSVGVQGDARIVGPVVFVRALTDVSSEEISRIATEVINRVRGITRVFLVCKPDLTSSN